MSDMTSKRRSPMKEELLKRVYWANRRGQTPTKYSIIGVVPSRTRGRHYRMLSDMQWWGYLEDVSPAGNKSAMRVTPQGIAALYEIAAFDGDDVLMQSLASDEVPT